jgi:heme-degrading monooxygenase HmoA
MAHPLRCNGHHGGMEPAHPEGPIVTIFRSRLRPGVGPEYEPLAERMLTLATAMPGFIDFKAFQAADGERVSIITFATIEDQRAWRDHPEHRVAQQRGRQELYEAFEITVCTPMAQRRFEG